VGKYDGMESPENIRKRTPGHEHVPSVGGLEKKEQGRQETSGA